MPETRMDLNMEKLRNLNEEMQSLMKMSKANLTKLIINRTYMFVKRSIFLYFKAFSTEKHV